MCWEQIKTLKRNNNFPMKTKDQILVIFPSVYKENKAKCV